MVWQLVVLPGTHTVTDVYNVLTVLLTGPELATTLATLDVVVVPLPEPELDNPLLPPPPPQDSNAAHAAAQTPRRSDRAPRPAVITPFARGALISVSRRA
jgi:hypothetical protein